jgi:hypothetical protein
VEHRGKLAIEVAIDGERVRAETLGSEMGSYVVVLDTTVVGQAIDLHSVYTGHPKVRTQVIHLLLTPGVSEVRTVEHEHEAIPVTHARRRCLFDHLQQLQEQLEQAGMEAQITIHDEAIAAIES